MERKVNKLTNQVSFLNTSIFHNGIDSCSLSNKLQSLGSRGNIEVMKSDLMSWMTDISLIGFENISMYQNNENARRNTRKLKFRI